MLLYAKIIYILHFISITSSIYMTKNSPEIMIWININEDFEVKNDEIDHVLWPLNVSLR